MFFDLFTYPLKINIMKKVYLLYSSNNKTGESHLFFIYSSRKKAEEAREVYDLLSEDYTHWIKEEPVY